MLVALNKIDLAPGAGAGREVIEISAKTGQGIDRLIAVLTERAAEAAGDAMGGVIEVLDDRDVQDALGGAVERRLRETDVAPLLARLLRETSPAQAYRLVRAAVVQPTHR